MIKIFECFFIIILISTYCQAQEKENKETSLILSDSSILKSPIILSFTYTDSISGHPVYLHELQNKLIIQSPACLVQSNSNQTLYIIHPGENINIKTASDLSLVFSIAGNEQRTNELNFFRLIIKKLGPLYNFFPSQSYQTRVSSLNDMMISEQKINIIKNERLAFLDSFYNKNLISRGFAKIAEALIRTTSFKDSLLLFWSNRSFLIKLKLFKTAVEEKLQAFQYIPYQPYSIYLNTCETLASMLTTKYMTYELKDSNDVKVRFSFADKNFKGLAKDFLMANALYLATDLKIPISKRLIETFNRGCSDSGYKKLIDSKINEKNNNLFNENNSLIYADGKKIKSLESIIDSYKGKIIVLDFWASWCAPCRKEMPFSKQLFKYYSNKNIVCLYISTDSNIRDWQNALEEESLDKEKNFLLLNSSTSIFIKSNKIQTIPWYIVLDKKGVIIKNNAPRPSDKALKEFLNKLLIN